LKSSRKNLTLSVLQMLLSKFGGIKKVENRLMGARRPG